MQMLLDEHKHLEFTFGDTQDVLRYDSTRFYREKIEKTISGICAVDFLCRDLSRDQSFLIEVKDFWYLNSSEAKEHETNETAENLAVSISRKVFNTISGLFIASFSSHCDDEEKEYAKLFLEKPLRIVFHYELPAKWSEERRKDRMAGMKQKLKNKLRIIDSSLRVEELSKTKYWTVKRKP